MEEVWKDIKDYEGVYQVSNLGRVKSLGNDASRKEKIRKPCTLKNGYQHVIMYKSRKEKSYLVHRLVYETFVGEIPEGMQVNHINENKTDNRLENLNLMSPKENVNWGTRNKKASEKLTNGKCSKPVVQYDLNNNFIKEWPSTHEVERQTGFDQGHISDCCKGILKKAYSYIWRYK